MKTKNVLVALIFLATSVYSQNIKTVQLRPKNNPHQYTAIVRLGDVLKLSFDDLDADSKQYQYKIEHMTHDWKPSSMTSNQYIQGFEQNEIINFSNSFNTLQPYTHYWVEIPNQNTIITKSGNYLISVLDEDYEVVFTRRCVFYEDITTVGVAVFRSRNASTTNEQQTVQFLINHPNLQINNPNQEINVTLFQNHNWNTAINNLEPVFIKPQQLQYNHTVATNFWAGNEFLNFDTKFIRSSSLNVARVEREEIYHSYLYTDEPRADKIYTYNPDINGQFVIRTTERDVINEQDNTEADYSLVHFSLDAYEPLNNKEVYVYGAFNNYELSEENKMTYDASQQIYKASIPFKQGFYNYSYATIDSNNTVDLYGIDGSFFETENEYTVIVYYKPFGEIYDRVIGVGNGYFNQNR
ncbi:type IX secretion system plug protein [Tenacibaculum crassostreae]|uniref:type IX secretion system plug protein n=1 Tax=Tenacibaculum crassostreae TaxID=502683 RepID=UPI003895BBF7